MRKSNDQFIQEAKLVHNNNYDYSNALYKTAHSKIIILCKIHGAFIQDPHSHLKGSGCPQCKRIILSQMYKENSDIFINKAKNIHIDMYDYSLVDYKKSQSKVKIICKKHGIFEQRPNDHLQGIGCPNCNTSKGELKITQFLKEHNINFIPQYKFKDCRNKQPLPFDFYLPKHNTCIEFDGEQHFSTRSKFYSSDIIKNDKIKNGYCSKNNIRLIRIPYTDIKNVNEKLISYLLKN